MALDNPVQINFDRYDGLTTVDADGSIHLPVIVRGSTIKFNFRLQDEDTGASIPLDNYTVEAQWRKFPNSTEPEARVSGVQNGVVMEVRVPHATVQEMDVGVGFFTMKYIINDGASDLHEHTFAVGQYYVIDGSLDS